MPRYIVPLFVVFDDMPSAEFALDGAVALQRSINTLSRTKYLKGCFIDEGLDVGEVGKGEEPHTVLDHCPPLQPERYEIVRLT